MIRPVKMFSKIIALSLVMAVCIASGLPSIEHLKLCFGSDGHVEFSESDCSISSNISLQSIPYLSRNKERHEDCIDVEMNCGTFDVGQYTLSRISSFSTILKRVFTSASMELGSTLQSVALPQSSAIYSQLSSRVLAQSQPVLLRTVILLI